MHFQRLEDDNTGENDKNHGNLSSDEDIVSEASENGSKRWKSAVDDRFFSLAEMEEYLDKQEKDQANSEGNLFEQFDKVSRISFIICGFQVTLFWIVILM